MSYIIGQDGLRCDDCGRQLRVWHSGPHADGDDGDYCLVCQHARAYERRRARVTVGVWLLVMAAAAWVLSQLPPSFD